MASKVNDTTINRWKRIHIYYKRTGFYSYLWINLKKAFLPIVAFIAVLTYVNYKYININELLSLLTQNYSDITVFSVFFLSESFLGLIPPDFFIAWTKTTSAPITY